MARITVEDCLEQVGDDNRFALVHLAVERIRQHREGGRIDIVDNDACFRLAWICRVSGFGEPGDDTVHWCWHRTARHIAGTSGAHRTR